MSYSFYNWLHIFSLLGVFTCLGAISIYVAGGGLREHFPFRRALGMTHGLGMLISFVAGFGLMTRGGYSFSENPWLFAKLGIWLLLGLSPFFVWRVRGPGAQRLFWVFIGMGILGSYLAIFKFQFPPPILF